ncbi:MFS general substrate transporter [Trametes polyzona]|nr:MFS general substrate transporter [Trametes polyzona]
MSQQTTLHAADTDEEAGHVPCPRGDAAPRRRGAEQTCQALAQKRYPGAGTHTDPYVVDWDLGDPENPFNWTRRRKWGITFQLATSTFTMAFCSSCYSGGMASMDRELHLTQIVGILGVSLYVLGFGLGPLVFAPLGELYGRRIVFIVTGSVFTLFHLGGALGHNATTILVTRALAGIFGSAPLTNAGGALSDMWIPRERGIASSLYGTAPWMGPVLGPIVGGWISETSLGWRFAFWIMFIVSALNAIACILVTPETFGPVLLRRRAKRLTKASGGAVVYISKHDVGRSQSISHILRRDMGRPFYFLATEPIVLLMAIYIAIAYATLYAFFAAYPIVFQRHRHFSAGEGGLAFLGIGLGCIIGLSLAPAQNRLYWRAMDRNGGRTVPEARLYLPMLGGIILPISLFWFAWCVVFCSMFLSILVFLNCSNRTSDPPVHWIVPVLAGTPFGMSCAVIMQGLTQYLMDTYSIYCASAIASTVVTRSVVAFIFPLISPALYGNLGDAWACSVFAFLALACTPVPFLFFRYGSWVRSRSKYALHDEAKPMAAPPRAVESVSDKKGGSVSSEKAVD